MNTSSLILEGGGNRGVFTAGVLDYLMEKEHEGLSERFPYVVGVSAGSCNAADYVSDQIGRTKDCMIVEDKDKRAFNLKHAILTKDLFNMDMVFDTYPNDYFPFDYDTYFASETKCEMTVTNCETGEAEYLSESSDREKLMNICRASCSLPTVSPMVEIDGKKYLDGGIADSIPIIHAMKLGYRKNVVILTRQKGYEKTRSAVSTAMYTTTYKDYPKLVNACYNRHHNYNRVLELVAKWEEEGHIFVIRPKEVNVGRVENDLEKLNAFYQQGREVMEEQFDALQEYLKK